MKIRFVCPHCKEPIKANSETVGDRMQCPSCKEVVLVPAQGIEEGTDVGGFRIEKRLGAGGMGEVFRATQTAMDRKVALKVLHPGVTNNKQMVERFIHEVKMSAKLEHPNIVTAFDAGQAGDYYYLAMSFVEGQNLEDRLKEGAIPEREAIEICYRVAQALNYAWNKHHMLHRDIKPANIMIDEDGVVKLMDMGIARTITEDSGLTMQGSLIGTPYYMSPEQATDSHDLDCRADIYSLGATLYHMVTGRQPFTGSNAMSVIAKHMSTDVPPPTLYAAELSQPCSTLICRMMEKDPENRPPDWDSLIAEMRDVRAHYTAAQALGPSGGVVARDFDSTAGMTVVSAADKAKAQAAAAAREGGGTVIAAKAAKHSAPTEVAMADLPAADEAPPTKSRGLLWAALVLIGLAAVAGLVVNQARQRQAGQPDPNPDNGRQVVVDNGQQEPGNGNTPVDPDDPKDPDQPNDPEDPVDPDQPDDPKDPDDPNGSDNGEPRFRVEDWDKDDKSPEQKKCKELVLAMHQTSITAGRNRDDWKQAAAAWKSYRDQQAELEPLLKASKPRERQFEPAVTEIRNKMQSTMTRVGNQHVKTLSAATEKLIETPNFNTKTAQTVSRKIKEFEEFLNGFDVVSDFAAATMQRWEQKKAGLERRFKTRKAAYDRHARAAARVDAAEQKLQGLEADWVAKGTLQPDAAGELKNELQQINNIKPDSAAERLCRELQKRISVLQTQQKLAATLQAERRKAVTVDLPPQFDSKAVQKEALQQVDLLRERIRGATDKTGSKAFIATELGVLDKFRRTIQAIPVEDPWVQYQRRGRELLARAAKALAAGKPARQPLLGAIAAFDRAVDKGILKQQPNANLLALLPENISDADTTRVIGALANPNVKVAAYAYATPAELKTIKEADRIWFRRYPRRINVVVKPGGNSAAVTLPFVLVPPARHGKYTVTQPFYIAVHEVSIGDYRGFSKQVLGKAIFTDDSLPVRGARYIDAVRFCNWLSRQADAKPAYKCAAADAAKSALEDWSRDAEAMSFALPRESEWAVACFYTGKDKKQIDSTVYKGRALKRPLNRDEIAKKKLTPNFLGALCMRGNVAELVSDLAGAALKREVVMGRDFRTAADDADDAIRQEIYPDDDRTGVGFRLALPATR